MIKHPLELWIIAFLLLFAVQTADAQDVVPDRSYIVLTDSINTIEPDNDSISPDILPSDSTVVKSDSIKKSTLDAPVYMTADSMEMVLEGGNFLYLYGKGTVKYQNMDLSAENIEMDADKNEIHAYFGVDTLNTRFGFPVFKNGEQESEMEKLWYNFNSQKMYTINAITKQDEGYITAGVAKKMPDDSFFMKDAHYTTCDDHEHPHFYFNLSKAKFRPGKSTITGPIYLVIEDLPTPIALPFCYLPTSTSYSSGILMPTYDDEMARGFALKDGGYYFAFNDYVDMAIRGEIWTKGSWGISTISNYKKLYKFSGKIDASYLVTVLGDKDTKGLPDSDYSLSRDIKISWSHQQDPKANPFGTFSANVQFSTSSYNRNDFRASTLAQMSENTKASSVSYSYRSPTLPLSISASASVNQRSRDSTLTVSLPDMTISLSNLYPFKRKEHIGSERWYEKIYMSYTGVIKNSISNVKENEFFKKNMTKDWKNGMKHTIPVSASFNLLKFITLSTSFNYSENWYSNRPNFEYDYDQKRVVPVDTVNGFFRTYDYNASISMNTKLYGMYEPWPVLAKLFGKWIRGTKIRHVFTPSVSFSGAPDFSDPKYKMYKNIYYFDNSMQPQYEQVSLYRNNLFGGPSRGRTGALNFSIDNNLEAKIPIAGTDSSRKVSLIDNLGLKMSYNFLADSMKWSPYLAASLRLKILKTNLSLNGNFDTYTYNENGQHINVPRWKAGKGFGRFMGTSAGYSYTLNNDTFKKLFRKGNKDSSDTDDTDSTTDTEENTDQGENKSTRTSLLSSKKNEGDYDSDGYAIFSVPWSLSFSYSINLAYDMQKFNKVTREYPYKISHTLGFSGNISPTKAWNITFGSSYDFDTKSIVNLYCTIARQMHCWTMSANIMPIGPFQNYGFSIAINSSILSDIKYQQSTNYRDALKWGN